ncbi:hypothetical protein NEOLI_002251 [Neolecta irregularis DAH-3]|uniref:DUF2427 domain-containing protein n=1 Tax=Neolecta irregularis (strain DAH-3) TaxID=1198029 RepID=A0A1U7LTN2_NEOID|nr:hypothetical protein NEOLI_002251 [Neolecta irregularis DAH-3]|eukprot:OLL25943.1 hypothetical protein NEOLI_002251 [Neolecta irregularis DAH-3]
MPNIADAITRLLLLLKWRSTLSILNKINKYTKATPALLPLDTHIGMLYVSLNDLHKRHEHHNENITMGEMISEDPIDMILWLHIIFMFLSFAIIFPIGMVVITLAVVDARYLD